MNEFTNKELLARIKDLKRQAEDLKRKNEDLEKQLESRPAGTNGPGPGNDQVNASDKGVAIKGSVTQSQIITGSGYIVGNVYTGSATENPEEALTIYRRVLFAGLR